MATFTINNGFSNQSTVEAESYSEEGSYVHFYSEQGQKVASIAKADVGTVHRSEK